MSPIPLADPCSSTRCVASRRPRGTASAIATRPLGAFDGIATAMAAGLERLDVFIDLGAGEHPRPSSCSRAPARAVGLRFPEGVNVVIAAALAGPGLDATRSA